ncbi:chitin deacetylase [Coprinopsis cinerea AmutBmut pab1-1]|nr:chitin deacetylase [Coprinopsis cinerea AmutBmut pab1-1]
MANYSFLTFFSFLSVLLASSSLLANASPISGLDLGLPEDCEAQVLTKCTVPNTVALTFDDGPYVYLKQVLDTLNEEGIKGTFFFNGNNFACIYSEEIVPAVKYAFETGHEIASHTWGHKNLSTLSWDEIHHEMFLVERALEKIVGVTPALMRPPFGEHNLLVRQASKLRGQTIVNWDFDSEDARAASVEEQKALYDEVVARRPESILSLQHEVHESSVFEVLPYAIKVLKEAGYNFVTVSECLGGIQPYQRVMEPSERDETWVCE